MAEKIKPAGNERIAKIMETECGPLACSSFPKCLKNGLKRVALDREDFFQNVLAEAVMEYLERNGIKVAK